MSPAKKPPKKKPTPKSAIVAADTQVSAIAVATVPQPPSDFSRPIPSSVVTLFRAVGEAVAKENFDVLSAGFLRGAFGANILEPLKVLNSPVLKEDERTAWHQALVNHGYSQETVENFFEKLLGCETTDFERYLQRRQEDVLDISSRLTTIGYLLALCRRSDALWKAFDNFRPVVNRMNATDLRDDILAITAELVDSMADGWWATVRRGVSKINDIRRTNRKEDAFVEAIRDAAVIQLDPSNIASGGLKTAHIVEAYKRVDPTGELSKEKTLALYGTVYSLLRGRGRHSKFSASIADAGLTNYAGIQAKLMEARMRLSETFTL